MAMTARGGWPNYLASVRTDPENNDEVSGRQADCLGAR